MSHLLERAIDCDDGDRAASHSGGARYRLDDVANTSFPRLAARPPAARSYHRQ